MSALAPDERWLLRAALGNGGEALAAWRAWSAATDFDALAGESVRLVPQLYRNLSRLGVDRAETARYASVYRHTWAANRMLFHAGAEAVASLAAAGIDAMLLSEAALVLLHYRDEGARALATLDVLVPWAQTRAAETALEASGWVRERVSPQQLVTGGAVRYRDANGRSLELHRFASQDAHTPGADDAFWRTAVPVELAGVRTLAPAPTELLYTVLIRAFSSGAPPLRWAADAATIIAGAAIDWERFVRLALQRRMVPALGSSLGWLRAELTLEIPERVLAALLRAPVSLVDRLEYRHRVAARPYTTGKVLLRLWTTHRRSSTARGVALALAFPRFLQRYYGASDALELPGLAVRRGLRRLRNEGL